MEIFNADYSFVRRENYGSSNAVQIWSRSRSRSRSFMVTERGRECQGDRVHFA